ncbi:MAG: hypothetical protein K2F95_00195 [Alistipes sp.]|nr:hypothetical protein [Alistipes sp.]MDE7129601.1 hypothetical protein [Alistipes sp.]
MKRETYAAIDIGSNAIRLLIDYAETYNDNRTEFKQTAFVRVPIRLGDDVFLRSHVAENKIEALCDAMQGFSSLFRAFAVRDYRACATSAMREAANGADIIERIRLRSGIDVEIIDGVQEAETIFDAGGLGSVIDRDKSYFYVDVGGGSTEVVIYASGGKIDAQSFALGTVRILTGAAREQEWHRFGEWLSAAAEKWRPSGIIASGGNINKAHKLLDKRSKECISDKELRKLRKRLEALSLEERMERYSMNSSRAEVIVPALTIFTTAVERCGIESIFVPKLGLADGIVRQLYKRYNP